MRARRTILYALLAVGIGSAAMAQEEGGNSPSFENLELQPVAEGFTSPVALVTAPGDERLFVVDRIGEVIALSQDGQRADTPFLDISDRLVELNPDYDERGLLGFAFHPQFADNGRAFAYYSAPVREGTPEGWNHTSVLSEFTLAADGSHLDPGSESVILEIPQPQMNHNGGQLLFGPDGYLYLGLGDGGGANDVGEGHPPMGNGQDVTTLKGSVLRIDVDVEVGYAIPQDNPFAGGFELPEGDWSGDEARPEIYLWGLRNPYRFSVDRETGALIVPDVGQNLWEEVNHVTQPGNLGWNLREGAYGFDPEAPDEFMAEGPTKGPLGRDLVDPVLTYAHPNVTAGVDEEERGISVSGGYIYRGSAIPELVGYYVFGDWSQSFTEPGGKLFVASTEETGGWEFVLDRQLDEFVLAFGEDDAGELYVLTAEQAGPQGDTGKVYRIVAGE